MPATLQSPVDLAADGLCTILEAAEYLGVSRSKVYTLLGTHLAFKKIGRCCRIYRSSLRAYANADAIGNVGGSV